MSKQRKQKQNNHFKHWKSLYKQKPLHLIVGLLSPGGASWRDRRPHRLLDHHAESAESASAIDAFAAFLANDALKDHRDDAEPEDDKSAKPAKKPRASKTAGKTKKA